MKAVVMTRKATKQEVIQAFKPQPEATIQHEFTYRNIAKMLASALQVEGEEFGAHVEVYLNQIDKLPTDCKRALHYAYIFSRKAPQQDREDLYQELAIKLLESRPCNDKLAYAIARCDWKDWWKAFKIRSNYSFDSIERLADSESASDYGQDAIDRQTYHSALLEGEIELERKADIDKLWSLLPKHIQAIVTKRFTGYALSTAERVAMCRYMKVHGGMLAEYR
ncbi:MAG: hypothetical protein PHY54_20325 [Methylococcales bacterium]|nr:hypothetical protein [Methylococcales bacterium]